MAKEKKVKKKVRKSVQKGHAYIQATFNNTIVSLTDKDGAVIASASAGSSGFKGARKSTPYAAQVAAENAVEKAKPYGMMQVTIFVKGIGPGREQAIRGLQSAGLDIDAIIDTTPMPHNGCRQKKPRRV